MDQANAQSLVAALISADLAAELINEGDESGDAVSKSSAPSAGHECTRGSV